MGKRWVSQFPYWRKYSANFFLKNRYLSEIKAFLELCFFLGALFHNHLLEFGLGDMAGFMLFALEFINHLTYALSPSQRWRENLLFIITWRKKICIYRKSPIATRALQPQIPVHYDCVETCNFCECDHKACRRVYLWFSDHLSTTLATWNIIAVLCGRSYDHFAIAYLRRISIVNFHCKT